MARSISLERDGEVADGLVEGSRRQYFLGTAMLVLVVLMWTSVRATPLSNSAELACCRGWTARPFLRTLTLLRLFRRRVS